MTATKPLPQVPPIGRAEEYYAHLVHEADKNGDKLGHEVAKVAQYLTLAMDRHLEWEQKGKYFKHVLKRHCQPPPQPDELEAKFFSNIATLVRQYAGLEALRLMSREDDLYAARLSMGQSRQSIEDEAEVFFGAIMGNGDEQPDWCNEGDWAQMKLIHDQWI
jgi:hypothetical protein